MSGRRHLGRVTAEFLTADGSLFNAIQSIIGQKLHECYRPPQEVPTEMQRLLTQLDDTESEIQDIANDPSA